MSTASRALATTAVSVRVPATSANLGPGFDALGLALDLWNNLTLEVADDQDCAVVTGQGCGQIPNAGTTVAHAAAHRVLAMLGKDVPGLKLTMENQIPLARGLGSSSAAIVGGLVAGHAWACNQGATPLTGQQILDIATNMEGHPDNVAPALMGGLVTSLTKEDGTAAAVQIPLPQLPHFTVFIPDQELATHAARGVLPTHFSRADAVFNLSRAAMLVGAMATGQLDVLPEALRDRIHQNQRAALVPGFYQLGEAAQAQGAFGATLSGAGPTILFWWPQSRRGDASCQETIAQVAKSLDIGGRVLALSVVSQGCHLV